MHHASFGISLAALLPALILCGYIYVKDKAEKEPPALLAVLFGLGALSYFPARFLERLAAGGLDRLFQKYIRFGEDGSAVYSSETSYLLHTAAVSFLAAGLAEILLKWCVLYFCTRNNRHFNYLFDGVVYAVFISLGFAAAENVRFAFINGWDTLLLHLLSSVPAHLFTGILMGYYFSRWTVHRDACRLEAAWLASGRIQEERLGTANGRLLLSFLIPLFVYGAFSFTAAMDARAVRTVFYFLLFSLCGVSFIGIDRIAAADAPSRKFSEKLLRTKHPEAQNEAKEEGDAL